MLNDQTIGAGKRPLFGSVYEPWLNWDEELDLKEHRIVHSR